jgi:hypothetical protein
MTTTTIAMPTSCAVLRTKLAELTQRIEDELAQAGKAGADRRRLGPPRRRERTAAPLGARSAA